LLTDQVASSAASSVWKAKRLRSSPSVDGA
jgi:hypothetical protein